MYQFIVHEYNQHMGGVERQQHVRTSMPRHQTLTAGTSKKLDLLAFTGNISTSLCLAIKPMEMSRRRRKIITRSEQDDIRLCQTSHWPVYNAEKKRCKLCKNIIEVSCGGTLLSLVWRDSRRLVLSVPVFWTLLLWRPCRLLR
ncbi:hypothetical protein T4E_10481 [Trichinella pseudospiralis]|uniref:PiggyBac transposable element-derived protein domain-containing protein n=1 Tax=Trichinella pseudospiralis TaxID=6337 RepID=A0A0V0XSE1_TRIPS|nr:hypothetical protein T4E_10481 [Trichinella pseudospiralis]